MVDIYTHYNSSVIGVEKITKDQSRSYGVISGKKLEPNLLKMDGIVEKPAPEDAPSNLGVVGRYILSPQIFTHIENLKPGSGGEYQLTDAIQTLLQKEQVLGYQYDGIGYDCGSKLGYLKATVEFALSHPDVSTEFKAYLKSNKSISSRSTK
jgi:UTP--glucose-1-phosphate uridylyltransferase